MTTYADVGRGEQSLSAEELEVVALRRRVRELEAALFNIAHLSRVCSVDDAIAEARAALGGPTS